MTDLKSKVLLGLRWSAAAKFGSQLITWAITIFVMRLLEPADYGLVAMAGVFVSLCLLLNEMGMGAAIVQAKELKAELLEQVFGVVILMNGFLCAALVLTATLIAQFYDEPRLAQIVPVLALQFPMWAAVVIPRAILAREMKFKTISLVEISNHFPPAFMKAFLKDSSSKPLVLFSNVNIGAEVGNLIP